MLLCEFESDLADKDDDSVCVRDDSPPVDSPDLDLSSPDDVVVGVSTVAVSSALSELFLLDRSAGSDDDDDDDDDVPPALENPVLDDDALLL